MVPRLVPEISSKCVFCDGAVAAVAVAGIGDSRSLIFATFFLSNSFSLGSHPFRLAESCKLSSFPKMKFGFTLMGPEVHERVFGF